MKLRYFIPFVFSALTLTACSFLNFNQNAVTNKTTITLNKTNLELGAGSSFTLVATVRSNDTSLNTSIKWAKESGGASSITVSSNGKVTVKSTASIGQTATIVASLKADASVFASCNVTVVENVPTAIKLSSSSLDIAPGSYRQLNVFYTPSNANAKTDVTWSSSNNSVATVDSNGKVTINSGATLGQTAKITAKLTQLPSITASCNITVAKSDYTVLIYMCGANLESDYANKTTIDGQSWYGWGLATMDIREILSVPNKPRDVNIVIETGGANTWTNNKYGQYSDDYSIDASKLQRHHVNSSGKIELDETLSYANMGLQSTLQNFVKYGLESYPADKTALILWNHGGGLSGVCFDEKAEDDSLLASEVANAVSGALSSTGHSGEKLEWIGYDACLMAVQDIASKNAPYFNYMIGSQETESGYGWAYDKWVDDLYAHKSTTEILTVICDEFVDDNNYDDYGVYHENYSENDQTLAYFDLNKFDAYRTAWENMATKINVSSSSKKTALNNLINSCRYYAGSSYRSYGLFDAKDFINKLVSTSTISSSDKPSSTYTNAVLTAMAEFVPHCAIGAGAGNSNGLCLFWRVSSRTMSYSASETTFTNWRSLCGSVNGN